MQERWIKKKKETLSPTFFLKKLVLANLELARGRFLDEEFRECRS